MPAKSTIKVKVDNGHIGLSGMVDRFTVNTLVRCIDLTKIDDKHLTLDFSQVERVDTAGLAWLLKFIGEAKRACQKVSLVALPSQLLKLAKTSGVEQLLEG